MGAEKSWTTIKRFCTIQDMKNRNELLQMPTAELIQSIIDLQKLMLELREENRHLREENRQMREENRHLKDELAKIKKSRPSQR